ncbi:hypothetical protein DYB32_002050 [Aphanomyces invadans]|uniref:tRNA (guanine(9)-N(1))-methyltransferase n=1 Tax=Aphanomyces invadans TaxID=157072 RepID=A0A418B692_9STRA|nr:hypothetical protein DYB32_002050 [Aphanomyces invadans]
METEGHDKEAAYEAKMVKKTVLARQRRKMRRKELLGSMTAGKASADVNASTSERNTYAEERKEFVANEAREEEERVRRLAEAPEKGQRIAIDCGYDGIMSNKEVSSLSKQIKFCYGTIKRMDNPFALTVTDCSEGSRIASALKRFSADKWSIKLEPSNVSSLYPQSRKQASMSRRVLKRQAKELTTSDEIQERDNNDVDANADDIGEVNA